METIRRLWRPNTETPYYLRYTVYMIDPIQKYIYIYKSFFKTKLIEKKRI